MVARSGRGSIEDWLQGGMQTETGFKSLGDQSPMLCCSRTLMDRRLKPSGDVALKCPRCDSANTKFCYYNNYSLTQPRYFCKTCRRYWTKGGSLRNVPVGGGCRKNKRGSKRSTADRTPATLRLQMNRTSSNSANSPSNIDNNNDVADCSPDNLDRRNGILPAVPSSVYYAVGLREGDCLGVAYPAVQHPRQHPAARATDQSGVAGNNNCSNSSSGMLICNGPEGPGLQSNLPPLVNLNAFQSLKSACSLISALEPPQTTCNRSGADQGSALMDIRGDLSSIFDVARQNQQQIATSSASAISHVSDGNFNDAFNLVAGHGNGLNDVEWQKHQKQVMIPLEDDNGQINLLLPFDHHETAVKELETHADRQRTLRPLAVTTTTGLQQPPTLNNIYEQNRSAGYNWQGPNLSESLIPNETSGCLNTTYWNMGGAWPDLSCYGPN